MQVIHARCCGLDVHNKTVVACVLVTAPDGAVQRRVQTFGTMTADLLALSDWLDGHGVTQIALESTGVYCAPYHGACNPSRREDRFGRIPVGQRLTWRRKPRGTTACRRSGAGRKACRAWPREARVLR